MSSLERITIDPDICHDKPTIRGLRYPVETIIELLIRNNNRRYIDRLP